MPIQLKRNDTKDVIGYSLTHADGTAVNLTGATVRFIMGKGKTLLTNASATIVDAVTGTVEYALTENDTLAAGVFNAEFEVTFGDGKIKTYPNNGYISVNIQANIDKDKSTYSQETQALYVSQVELFKTEINEKVAITQQLIDGSFDDGLLKTNIEGKLNNLEVQYAPRLTSAETSLAQKANKDEMIDNYNRLTKTINKMFTGVSTKIVAFGDSLTWGQNPVGGAQVTNHYPAVLQSKLRKVYENNNITVVNKGIGGNTTAMALSRIQADVITQAPDLTIVMFGINDGNPATSTSRETFKANMISIVKTILQSGSEVLLLSPTPIIKPDSNRTRSLQTYSRITQEIARQYNLAYIDMFDELHQFYFNKQEAPSLMLPDMVHLEATKYKYLAEIIMGRALDYHNQSGVLSIDSRNPLTVPVVGSPFIDTDLSSGAGVAGQFYQQHYTLQSDHVGGTKIRFQFYVSVAGMDLVILNPRSIAGGKITVLDNDVAIKTIDCFTSNTSGNYDAETVLIENLSIGYHVIEFLSSNIVVGQSSTGVGKFYLSAISIRPTANKPSDKFVGGGTGTIEKFKKVNDGTIRFISAGTNETAVLLLSSEYATLKTGKTLAIELEGKIFKSFGFSWFGNPSMTLDKAMRGYVLYVSDTVMELRLATESGIGTAIASYTTSLDFAQAHKIRITHTESGVITVFLNGVQVIQTTNTKEQNGWFGFRGFEAGTAEIARLEYAYI